MHDGIKELLSGYVDNEVSVQERRDIEEHLHICTECSREVEDLLWLKREMAVVYSLNMEPNLQFEQAVMNEIRKHNQQIQAMSRGKRAAVGFLAVLLFSVFLLQTSPFMYVAVKFAFAFLNIGISLIHALGAILSSVPYVMEIMMLTVILILVFSGWSIRRLLVTKTIG
jgi:predicted anti-sigma-YlaC factor YlaD